MNIVIAGGSGFIGRHLTQRLKQSHMVWVLSRNPKPGYSIGLQDLDQLEHIDVVINMAGAGIAEQLWTPARMRELRSSRVDYSQALAKALEGRHLKHYLAGSAVGLYGNTNQPHGEQAPAAQDFLGQLCQDWEATAGLFSAEHTTLLRTGLVLGQGGLLKTMALPFKFGFGATLGTGKQYMPWIHIKDYVRAVEFLLNTPIAAVNMCGPNPCTNQEFSRALAKTFGKPLWFNAPTPLLKLAGGLGTALLEGQRALPQALLSAGFNFEYTTLEGALADIYAKP